MQKIRKAVLPVAGFGTRFLPATKAMPKELMPILGKPVVQYAVEEAIAAGCDTLIFVTGRHKRAIEDHFDSNLELESALRAKGKDAEADMVRNIIPTNVECLFVRQPEQLGLGHAVACAERALNGDPFVVLLADDFIRSEGQGVTADLIAAYEETGRSQLSVMQIDGPELSKFGVITPGAEPRSVTGIVEKPDLQDAPSNLASIGRYVLTPDVFDILRGQTPGYGGEIQLADALNEMALAGRVESVLLRGKRYDCGSMDGYLDAIDAMARETALISHRAEPLTCFKAYDIRGVLGETIDEDIAYRIGRSFAGVMAASKVVVGHDARESSPALAAATARGLADAGCTVLNIGLAGTEEMYFATSHFGADGGIEITASHNPINYNGMKMVGPGSRPLDPATELAQIRQMAEAADFADAPVKGTLKPVGFAARAAYADKVMSFIEPSVLRPLKVVVNCGNGAAAPAYEAIKTRLQQHGAPLSFVDLFLEPDPAFPNGIPNPLLAENQPATRDAVLAQGADLGVAFDGDFDRCFFFDENGDFVPGEYVVGLLAAAFLEKEPGAGIVHDPRVVWSIQDIIQRGGGTAIQSRTGHVFLKQELRKHGAVYGGEMSAHHYFRDFCNCDSGMIPWLLVCELMGRTGQSLSALVSASAAAFPSSGEINFRLPDPQAAMDRVVARFEPDAVSVDRTDGVSVALADWRLNLRASNTEPVIRLNVESRGNPALVEKMVAQIRAILTQDA